MCLGDTEAFDEISHSAAQCRAFPSHRPMAENHPFIEHSSETSSHLFHGLFHCFRMSRHSCQLYSLTRSAPSYLSLNHPSYMTYVTLGSTQLKCTANQIRCSTYIHTYFYTFLTYIHYTHISYTCCADVGFEKCSESLADECTSVSTLLSLQLLINSTATSLSRLLTPVNSENRC